MTKIWFDEAWEEYLYWQTQDKKTIKRINMLIKDIERTNFDGIGKPEPLKGDYEDQKILTRFFVQVGNGKCDRYGISAIFTALEPTAENRP